MLIVISDDERARREKSIEWNLWNLYRSFNKRMSTIEDICVRSLQVMSSSSHSAGEHCWFSQKNENKRGLSEWITCLLHFGLLGEAGSRWVGGKCLYQYKNRYQIGQASLVMSLVEHHQNNLFQSAANFVVVGLMLMKTATSFSSCFNHLLTVAPSFLEAPFECEDRHKEFERKMQQQLLSNIPFYSSELLVVIYGSSSWPLIIQVAS